MPAWFIPFLAQGIGMGAQALLNRGAAKQQYGYSRDIAAFQHQQNMELMKYQLDYNSPASQMARFKDAGLNPNLVYGQGTPGNLDSPPRYPDIEPPQLQAATADLFTKLQQGRLLASQADLTNQRVEESGVKQELMRAQKDLVKANPYMRQEYVDAMFLNLRSMARIKENEAGVLTRYQSDDNYTNSIGQRKILKELELLEQRYNLGAADQKIKAEIIETKEFQNSLLEVQKKWMTDAEITPQHIYQFMMILMQRLAMR